MMLIRVGAAALLSITLAGADDLAETARKVRAAYAAAQVEWQRGLAGLVIEKRAEFEAVATAQRDLQLGYVELSTARFEYLVEQHPSRIVLTKGLSAFANFAWSEEDTKTLTAADSSYAALERKVAALRKRNDDHPSWPSFREYFRTDLAKSSEYQALLSEFMEKQKAVGALLLPQQLR
ncbi:MAG: hypothetical protein GY953_13550 [bacterium]|nr:hypothetical protein [bacterium]